jgi:hypothetical protein
MQRIDASTVKMSADEQIIGDFYLYLREERGMNRFATFTYLRQLNPRGVLTEELMDYLDDIDQPVPEPVPEGKAPRNAWNTMYADAEGNWIAPEAEAAWQEMHVFRARGPARSSPDPTSPAYQEAAKAAWKIVASGVRSFMMGGMPGWDDLPPATQYTVQEAVAAAQAVILASK